MKSSTADTHFITFGFTNDLGKLILCRIIINGKKATADQVLGFDIMKLSESYQINTDDIFLQNMGKNEMFPGGTTCKFEDKIIPPL